MNKKSNSHIPAHETRSLTKKFKQLWLTGSEAKLVFETRAGKAWGTLHVCLGEHPYHDATQLPPNPQEHQKGKDTPSKRRRRERREAARSAAAKAAPVSQEEVEEGEAEEATEADETSVIAEEVVTLHSKTDKSADNEVTEEVAQSDKVQKLPLFVTDIDDEVCSDEEYYDEIDAKSAPTCLQCKI